MGATKRTYFCIEKNEGHDRLSGYDKNENKIFTLDHKLKLEPADPYYSKGTCGSVQAMDRAEREYYGY